MTAPDHLRGPMNAYTPVKRRAERYEWVEAKLGSGASKEQVAKALGINWRTVHSILQRDKPAPPDRWRVIVRTADDRRVQHVIKAPDETAAVSKGLRAYPGGTVIDVCEVAA